MAAPTATTEVTEESPVTEPVEAAVTMPDLFGLTEAQAREALSDAGIDTEDLTVSRRPYLGASDRVVIQVPTRGSSNPKNIELVLSEDASVPDVIGSTQGDAEELISDLGAAVELKRVYAPDIPAGHVAAVSPAVGQPLTEAVVLEVSNGPATVYLPTLTDIQGSCSTSDPRNIGGTMTDTALSCRASWASDDVDPVALYEVNRRADRFKAEVGISNDEDPGARARVRVQADGRDVFDEMVGFNAPVGIDVPLTGAAQLRILVTVGEDADQTPVVVFADATLLGSPDGIGELR